MGKKINERETVVGEITDFFFLHIFPFIIKNVGLMTYATVNFIS